MTELQVCMELMRRSLWSNNFVTTGLNKFFWIHNWKLYDTKKKSYFSISIHFNSLRVQFKIEPFFVKFDIWNLESDINWNWCWLESWACWQDLFVCYLPFPLVQGESGLLPDIHSLIWSEPSANIMVGAGLAALDSMSHLYSPITLPNAINICLTIN